MALRRFSICAPLIIRNLNRYSIVKHAAISTSKKNKDTLAIPEEIFPKKQPPGPKTVEDFADTKNQKSWISYGWDYEDYEEDRHQWMLGTFLLLTVLICGGTFLFAYAPDLREKDWFTREAYLEIHRREKLGLPHVDKNFVDPAKIQLPSDEELGDTPIVI